MVRLQDRVLVYHCRTLIRELDLAMGHHNRSPLLTIKFRRPRADYARAGV